MNLHVTYVARNFWPDISGAARVTSELAKGLAERGHRLSLFLPNSQYEHMVANAEMRSILDRRFSVHHFGPRLSRLLGETVSFFFLLFRVIPAGFQSHVILAHYHHSNLCAFCAAIASLVTQRPLVVRADDVVAKPSNIAQTIILLIFRLFTRWCFRRASSVLVPGDELVELAKRMHGGKNATVGVSYNGVDTKRFRRENRNHFLRQTLGSKHIVIFSGELTALDGIEVLVQAAVLLKEHVPDLMVLVIGDGPERGRLMRLADSLGLGLSLIHI